MDCQTDISRLIDKNILSIEVEYLKDALSEIDDSYPMFFSTSDCLTDSLILKRYGKEENGGITITCADFRKGLAGFDDRQVIVLKTQDRNIISVIRKYGFR